jgi:hypothetical protein
MKKINFKNFKINYTPCPVMTGNNNGSPDDHIDAMRYVVEDNMKYRKNRPLAYKIYEYLKKNAIGYENRVKSGSLMKPFEIQNNKTLRSYIEEIRDSDILQKIICSEAGKNGGYWIATSEDEVYQTLQHLYKRSIKMLHTYSIIKRKSNLNNQLRMKLNKYEKDIYKSILEVTNENNDKII